MPIEDTSRESPDSQNTANDLVGTLDKANDTLDKANDILANSHNVLNAIFAYQADPSAENRQKMREAKARLDQSLK